MEKRFPLAARWESAAGAPPIPAEVAPLLASFARSPDPIFVTNRLNRIVAWNRSAERLLGYSGGEAAGLSCAALLCGCDVHGNRYCTESCPVTQIASRHETVLNFVLRLRAKDGRTLLADMSVIHLEVQAPDLFLLAHVLHPHSTTPVAEETAAAGAPRPPLDLVRESLDARARKLTGREVEILGMLAAGHTTPAMASRLQISPLTVRNHVQNILDKLEVHSKSEAVAFAFQKHLV